MALEPIYAPKDVNPSYHLRYTWTGWPTGDRQFPARPDDSVFQQLAEAWRDDGIRLLDVQWADQKLAILTSSTPEISPTFLAARIKGRLQHALRNNGTPTKFSRKLSVSTVGHNRRDEVEFYVRNQVEREPWADPQFKEFLRQFTVTSNTVDLSTPTATDSGRYWYNLHLVLVIRDRAKITNEDWLETLRDTTLRIAEARQDRISALSVMPDHLHIALRGHIQRSPQEIALSYMNNLAHVLQMNALWQPSYYVGSFGEYDMNALRCRRDGKAPSPPT